jgi:hypothetical protein
MSKQHYFFKLIPPRPTFPYDISDAEKLIMKEHASYFREQFAAGRVLLFGPVLTDTRSTPCSSTAPRRNEPELAAVGDGSSSS